MRDLKPCPICGGEAVPRLVGDHKQYIVLFCSSCGKTPVHTDEARWTVIGAKMIWNRRATDEH